MYFPFLNAYSSLAIILGYALLDASSATTPMSSTVTATTSPPTRFQFQSTALPVPGRSDSLLTTFSRPAVPTDNATANSGPAPSDGEPPAKRARLNRAQDDQQDALNRCLKEQIFPHVFRNLDTLRDLKPDKILQVGRELTLLLTSPGSEFAQEYHSRGTGRITAALEAKIAASVPHELQNLLSRPNVGSTSPEEPVPKGLARISSGPRYSSSPIPIPRIPPTIGTLPDQIRNPAKASVGQAALISKSPIPLPQLPPTRAQGAADSQAVVVKESPRNTPLRKIETIVIDDDSADEAAPAPRKSAVLSLTPTRVFAPGWRDAASVPPTQPTQRQPYITFKDRAFAVGYAHGYFDDLPSNSVDPITIHIDFTAQQIQRLNDLAARVFPADVKKKKRDGHSQLAKLLKNKKLPDVTSRLLDAWEADHEHQRLFPGRERKDVDNFFKDLKNRQINNRPTSIILRKDEANQQGKFLRESKISSMLFAREIVGSRGYGSMRRPQNFNNEIRKCREDEMALRAEWAGGAGDIITITWISDDGFICGTTEHSDSHNQQYNKPGNLVLGSCSLKTLKGYPDHRIVRPIVERGENSTDAMRQSQDPWLYSSVVSSAYDAIHDRAYTSGFDCCVKVWRAEPSGASMSLLGEWKHEGNVNFVIASKHSSGMVATAADVAAGAVRIYKVNETDISGSPFGRLSCSRVTDERGNLVPTEKWAYYPATMQWGICDGVQHLLLVGYSPRSRTGEDFDIPEDRKNSGELCLWDGLTGKRLNILSAEKSNVFEVLWHPSQPCFIAATSPSGLDLVPKTKTQIRIFRPTDPAEDGTAQFSAIKVLDCPALDINELTIMPNSPAYCYVTAGCTNGKVYVWDTAPGRGLIHLLEHGQPIDECEGDRERYDVGVKFTAWGTSPDRFYTGSSDGVVKVWDVRSLKKPLVRVLLEAPAPVACGMFSPDKSRLVVGDASGRVFVLSIYEEDDHPKPKDKIKLPNGVVREVERPHPIIPHPEPEPPTHDAEGRALPPPEVEAPGAIAKAYLASGQLVIHPNQTIGAVQGPNYPSTGLFCAEAHMNGDPNAPLLGQWLCVQQEEKMLSRGSSFRIRNLCLKPIREQPGLEEMHLRNRSRDVLDLDSLPEETKRELEREVDFGLMREYTLPYEEFPEMEGGDGGEDEDEDMDEL
ncbi:hypothetical protein QBC41DRAFT_308802 [Cercophora samala]|uniref:Uncharacterized protein n=1 Tax=Cercophora samala TaxID=330535 RepID=A0AA39ZNQ7_9PEZI|nr:hypothetical protein QBC41DRAFT_308802 [Cercophora samala]